MEYVAQIMPVLWQIIDKQKNKRKCRVNVSTIDDKMTVSFLFGRRTKRFSHKDSKVLLEELQQYLLVA